MARKRTDDEAEYERKKLRELRKEVRHQKKKLTAAQKKNWGKKKPNIDETSDKDIELKCSECGGFNIKVINIYTPAKGDVPYKVCQDCKHREKV